MEATLTSVQWKPVVHNGRSKPSNDDFANAQIDAYVQGRKDEADQVRKFVVAQIKSNTELAAKLAKQVLAYLKAKGFHPGVTRLRIVELDRLDILIEVPEQEFLSKKFLSVYTLANKLEKEHRSDVFNIAFSFLGNGGKVDDAHLRSDGFTFTLRS